MDDEKKKINKAWDLPEINEKYEKFMQKARFESVERKTFWPLFAKKLEKEFSLIYETDPHLPEEILPVPPAGGWRGREAYGVFKAISNSY